MRYLSCQQPKTIQIGWVIGDKYNPYFPYRSSVVTSGGSGLARYGWIAHSVNTTSTYKLHYSLYRKWRRYDVLLFLKSMGPRSLKILRRHRKRGGISIFDSNVNYYESYGNEYYRDMLPSERQYEQAVAMTKAADGVIADSEYIASVASQYSDNVHWIPDSVDLEALPSYQPWKLKNKRIRLLWSGQSLKLFELLAIEEILREWRDRVELVMVTNSLDALDRWHKPYRKRFESLLGALTYRFIHFRSVAQLLAVYTSGGVVISPRFLDNSYNLGHTEWKITLGMACGRVALCSPQPSYVKVYERSEGKGIRICRCAENWREALEEIINRKLDMVAEGIAAKNVVERYYAANVVAGEHACYITQIVKSNR